VAFAALFLAASALMVWRLDAMTAYGFEGTALGTLVMPFCSGLGNLIFVVVLVRTGGPGTEVLTNALVNNVTNLTLLLGLPALWFGLRVMPEKRVRKPELIERRLHRLSLLFTILAVGFFSGAVWALSRDGRLDFGDGLVLVGLFVFWQCFHVFEVLKHNVRRSRSPNPLRLAIDFALLAVGAVGLYWSIEWLVAWLMRAEGEWLGPSRLGWVTGWLMVLPNALLALYYGWRRRADIVYSSQVGDGHICIPLGIGLFALFAPIETPPFLAAGLLLTAAAAAVHFVCVGVLGGLPRWVGLLLVAAYGWFLHEGLLA
jgi:cation:H+ antiporter